jgi:KDO2-lipid IV(A) lauroyltransferase
MAKIYQKTGEFLRDWLGVIAIWASYIFIPLFPLKVSYVIARAFSKVSLKFLKKQKNIILGNLELAFGDKMSKEEKMEIALEMVTNLFKGFFEGFYSACPFRKKVYDIITIEGRENLDQALSLGKGVIALSAHFGNFAILGAVMTKEEYPFHMVIRDPKSKLVARAFRVFRDLSGQKTIVTQPWRECSKKILRCLRNNEIICLITDENKRRGGVKVDFFGQNTPTAMGPAVFSLRTGAAIVPIFIVRQKDDTHKVIIEPPLEFNLTGVQTEDIRHITGVFTERIESYIKAYPAQWWWLNRRWKEVSTGDKYHRG